MTPEPADQTGAWTSMPRLVARKTDSFLSLDPSFHQAFLDAFPVPVLVLNREHLVQYANPALCEIFGLPLEALVSRTLWEYWPDGELEFLRDTINVVLTTREPSKVEFFLAESTICYEASLTWWNDHVTATFNDVTMQRLAASFMGEQLVQSQEASNTDALTGLANRRRAYDLGHGFFSEVGVGVECLSLIMLDIDHFKAFNDTFGHIEGDNVLRAVGATIKAFVSNDESAARIGGEEFLVICPNATSEHTVQRATALLASIRDISGTARTVTASLGVATADPADSDWLRVLERSDRALYAAKSRGETKLFYTRMPSNNNRGPGCCWL